MGKKVARRITPLPDQVVLRSHQPKHTEGLIIIPETAELPVRLDHTVMAIGKEARKKLPTLKLGSKIIIKKNHGVEVTLDDINYTIIKCEHIEATCSKT